MDKEKLRGLIRLALEEDLGETGDMTSKALFNTETAEAKIVSKCEAVVCGAEVAAMVFQEVDPETGVAILINDGEKCRPGDTLMEIAGKTASILTAERTALNFLHHLSGISTKTARLVKIVAGLPVKVSDTRKTIPGLRGLEKYAVKKGGGINHRMGLYDAVLIKNNHINAAGSIKNAMEKARSVLGKEVSVEVEAGTLEQVAEALSAGADIIMLDNMAPEKMKEAVTGINGRALVEASGGINESNIRQVAESGVNIISIGSLTMNPDPVDFSLRIARREK